MQVLEMSGRDSLLAVTSECKPQLLFVYGTLQPGERLFSAIEDWVVVSRAARTRGVLVDLGGFPAMIQGDGVVRGFLLEVDSRALAVTDRIEGYVPERGHSLFIRMEVPVQVENGE